MRDLALFDLATARNGGAPGVALAYSVSRRRRRRLARGGRQLAAHRRLDAAAVGDAPGLVVARTVAMLVNEACDAVLQGVCTPEGADLAMKLGVNYPPGPFEFLAGWDARGGRRAARPLDCALPRRALTASAPACAGAPGSRGSARPAA